MAGRSFVDQVRETMTIPRHGFGDAPDPKELERQEREIQWTRECYAWEHKVQMRTPESKEVLYAYVGAVFSARGAVVRKANGLELVLSSNDEELLRRAQHVMGSTGTVYGPYGPTYRLRMRLTAQIAKLLIDRLGPYLTDNAVKKLDGAVAFFVLQEQESPEAMLRERGRFAKVLAYDEEMLVDDSDEERAGG